MDSTKIWRLLGLAPELRKEGNLRGLTTEAQRSRSGKMVARGSAWVLKLPKSPLKLERAAKQKRKRKSQPLVRDIHDKTSG